MRYLDPKNDLTFKKIFGEHPHLLKSFLNGVLPFETEEDEIESLEYLNPEQVPDNSLLKNSLVDVKCKDKKGRQFIVEMQMLWTENFKSRVIFNASKAYVRQLERGGKWEALQPVYALSIINEVFMPDIETYYHHYKIAHIENKEEQIEGLEFIFIELPKFKPDTIPLKKMGILWLRFLKEIKDQSEKVPKEFTEEKYINEALTYLKESSFSNDELEFYDKYWDIISTEKTIRSDSISKGLKQGMEKGMEKGLKQGIEKGEEQEKIKRIKKILQQNLLSVAQIAQLFEVSEDFVLKVKNKIK